MELETAPDDLVRGDLEAQLADLDRRIGKADEPSVACKGTACGYGQDRGDGAAGRQARDRTA